MDDNAETGQVKMVPKPHFSGNAILVSGVTENGSGSKGLNVV